MLNLYKIETHNYVNGNGCRYVIWVQGCTLRCKGCWNTETWSCSKNILKTVESVYLDIIRYRDIDGVTFVGGEPLLQSYDLLRLARMIKASTNLGLQIFTGFEPDEFKTEEQKALLDLADTVVMGRFDNTKENNNQKVFNKMKSDIWEFNNTDVEVELDDNLDMLITGYPSKELLDVFYGVEKNERIKNKY